ncbi:LCP family protein [Proteinivorax hydrogeniformans]|uniref:LCP family protein n=1 Tax=Proteinivorax hydrogeniformans TaxID=1826727 RepID=A0AAU8HWU3_9FIRM
MSQIYTQGRSNPDPNLVNALFVRTNNHEAEYLMVAQYNEETEKMAMIIIPKESYTKIPSRGFNQLGLSYGTLGLEGLKTTTENLLDIDIHYHVHITRSSVRTIMNAFETQLGVEIPPAGTPSQEAITQMTTDIRNVRNVPKYISLILEVAPHINTNIGPTAIVNHRQILYKIPNTQVEVIELKGEPIDIENKQYLKLDIPTWRKNVEKVTY